ncbi:hypothetical protein [Pseudomonas arsenicoxydans]|uniref:hypothetical protein n=1 Tax=Pseudomonas arsenicoxydans TaxID=702115 RepID=UPI0012FE443F|nr:hypothetical protein [Pseudomonas arsenicoxydans]
MSGQLNLLEFKLMRAGLAVAQIFNLEDAHGLFLLLGAIKKPDQKVSFSSTADPKLIIEGALCSLRHGLRSPGAVSL